MTRRWAEPKEPLRSLMLPRLASLALTNDYLPGYLFNHTVASLLWRGGVTGGYCYFYRDGTS